MLKVHVHKVVLFCCLEHKYMYAERIYLYRIVHKIYIIVSTNDYTMYMYLPCYLLLFV